MNIVIKDIKINMSFYFSALMSFLFIFSDDVFLIASVFFVFIHELAHVLMMIYIKSKIDEIKLLPFGVKIIRNQTINTNYKSDIIIYSVGIISNLTMFFIFYFLYLKSMNSTFLTYSLINFYLALFNILPISVLDGGQILKILIINKMGFINGERLFFLVSSLFSVFLFFISFCLTFFYNYSITLVITSIYLIYSNFKS